ncbi:hypothetical protein QKW60_03520 [Defluviimonas aestuarii]|uniref:hypothetical protein n=1 Tax=Albidovulum aestuarii TaxID=1130726 RepID=UPI00249C50EA|nr:hypothetical protein [Defluviimonas aestuarii]MDI3335466.1 hypothetical protein [Defluviimonas aestuarii]
MEMSASPSILARLARRLHRETRLLGFVISLSFLAGFVMYVRYDVMVFGMPMPLFTGLLYAGFVGTAATLVSLLLPALRAMIEAAAISRLGIALAAYGVPEFGLKLATSPLLSATVIVVGAVLVRKLFGTATFAHWSVLAHETSYEASGGGRTAEAS